MKWMLFLILTSLFNFTAQADVFQKEEYLKKLNCENSEIILKIDVVQEHSSSVAIVSWKVINKKSLKAFEFMGYLLTSPQSRTEKISSEKLGNEISFRSTDLGSKVLVKDMRAQIILDNEKLNELSCQ